MRKQRIALVAQHRAVNDARHVTARGHFCGVNLNLVAMPVCVINRSAVDHTVKTRPQSGAHAHGAWFTGGVKRVPGKRDLFEPFGGEANGAHFSVCTGIELLPHGIERAQQHFTCLGMND